MTAPTIPGLRRVFIRDFVTSCSIGVHHHETLAVQRIRVNIALDVDAGAAPLEDRLANVVNYDTVLGRIRGRIAAGHIRLVETLAERIASVCLEDGRVRLVRVTVEKLDVYDDVAGVGVTIERAN